MVSAMPIQLQFDSFRNGKSYVKAADGGIVNYNEDVLPQELITSLLFEDVGAVELINVARHDFIDGTPVGYSLIGNLTSVRTMFNSTNIIPGFTTGNAYTDQYSIDIGQMIDSVYFDDEGNLVIDMVSIGQDEEVDVSILADGIIYST